MKFEIRDHIDLQTLKMIWLWGDYDLENLRRGQEIQANYAKIALRNKIPLIIDLGGMPAFLQRILHTFIPRLK